MLEKYGCFCGSHAVVILSDKDDMKAVALNLMRFFEDELRLCARPAGREPRRPPADGNRPVGSGVVDRALGRHARRLDLRPRQAAPNPLLSVLKTFPRS